MLDGRVHALLRLSSRHFYAESGRDAVQRVGLARTARYTARFGAVGVERAKWEREERLSRDVMAKRPDVAAWAAEYPGVEAKFEAQAKARSKVGLRESEFLHELVGSILATFAGMGGTKAPVIIMGKEVGTGRGVRGTRGHGGSTVRDFLAEFFTIFMIDEYNTTKNCPKCHQPTDFAFKHEHRTKKCESCHMHDDDQQSGPFHYDRDFGAAINMAYVADYMARNKGRRPTAFKRPVQKKKKRDVKTSPGVYAK